MKKIWKFCLTLLLISAIIAIGTFIAWIVASVFVVRYLFKLKGKYENPKDCLKEGKNIIAVVAAVLLLIVIPAGYIKSSKEYEQEQKIKQEQQAILDQQKEMEQKEKQEAKERANVLKAKSRLKKEVRKGSSIDSGIALTESEIEKYDITEEEILKFNEDVDKAIRELKEAEMAKKYKVEARKYVRRNVSSSTAKVNTAVYSFNEDQSICTIEGIYTSKNVYGVNVRGEYTLEFDTSSGQIIDEFIGNEKVI